MECTICLEKGDKKSFVQKPSLVTLANLLERKRERAQFKDCSVLDFVERLESNTSEQLFERKINYHDKCYSSLANVNKLDHARKCFAESINTGESSVVKRKKGRPSLTGETTGIDNKLPRTRPKAEQCDKTMCIICQKPGVCTCKMAFKESSTKVWRQNFFHTT